MRLLLVLAALLAAGAAVPAGAAACVCAPGDAEERLRGATAAFTGTVVERRARPGDAGPTEFTFKVERVLKGDLGEAVTVHSAFTSCQVTFEVGQRANLLLHGQEPWEVTGCSVLSDADVRRISDPERQPTGSGRVAALVSGDFGRASLLALDRRGRPLAYGAGGVRRRQPFGAQPVPVSVCPGSRYALQGGDRVLTRRLSDLRIVATRRFAADQISCLSADGRRAALASHGARRGPGVSLLTGARRRALVRPAQGRAVLGRKLALVFAGSGPSLLDYRSGRLRALPFAADRTHAAALTSDDRRLAVFVGDSADPVGAGRIVVLDTRTLVQRELAVPAETAGSLAWAGLRRLVVAPLSYRGTPARGPRVFTSTLAEIGELDLKLGIHVAALADDLWSLDRDGVAHVTRLPSGPTREAAVLPDRFGYALAVVPGRPRVRASAATRGSRPRARRAQAAAGAPCRTEGMGAGAP